MQRRLENQKSKNELLHNKLHRKLKRAIRRNETYKHLLPSLDRLDDEIAQRVDNWAKRSYYKLIKDSNAKNANL